VGELYALVSAGGSPGVTTAAIALALAWPSPVIVVECDPSGGDVLPGLLSGHVPASHSLMELAIEAGRDAQAAARGLGARLIPLDADRRRTLLPGLTDPRQAIGLASAWPAITTTLRAQNADVIADCGRFDAGSSQPLAVLSAASTVAIVLRPTLRQVWSARPRVDMLTQLVGSSSRLALLINGRGTHSAREVSRALGVPVAFALPDDSRSAALLSDGLGDWRNITSGALMRSARAAGRALRGDEAVRAHQAAAAGSSR
jgi:hypothetical protein